MTAIRVVTVTLNPAIDQTIRLDRLRPGQVHRARAVRHDAGGKGVNVASCLADWGVPVAAAGILGGENAGVFEALFARKGIKDACLRVDGETRTNIKIAADDATTDINLPGLSCDAGILGRVAASVREAGSPPAFCLLAGSLPEGLPAYGYRLLAAELGAAGYRIVVDTSGAALEATLAPGAAPPVVLKPNRHELEELAGHPLPAIADVVAAAERLRNRGILHVVVSLGPEGALFCGPEGRRLARLAADPASTVGAGDAMVAGILAALTEDPGPDRLARLATAFAVGKLGLPGPNLPPRDTIERLAGAVDISSV